MIPLAALYMAAPEARLDSDDGGHSVIGGVLREDLDGQQRRLLGTFNPFGEGFHF